MHAYIKLQKSSNKKYGSVDLRGKFVKPEEGSGSINATPSNSRPKESSLVPALILMERFLFNDSVVKATQANFSSSSELNYSFMVNGFKL